jgi:ADP-heptose:LPS heptosyltransferase
VTENLLYYHIYNPVFDSREFMKWAGLRRFLGVVPSSWRRFDPRDWSEIKKFIEQNSIDLVINLRNEGPLRDLGYFRFKEEMAGLGIEFWELDQATIANRSAHRHLILDQLNLLALHGIDLFSFNKLWLKDYTVSNGGARPKGREVGFFTGASQSVKTWLADQWITLGSLLLNHTSYKLTVYAGQLDHELDLARSVVEQLQSRFQASRCYLVKGLTLESLCAHLTGLDLLVSNDTSSVHMAAALDLPTVGLYFSTDSAIWGGLSEKFTPVQSQLGLACPSFKHDAGNCNFYYGGCPGPCRDEITPEKVYQAIEHHLSTVACDYTGVTAENVMGCRSDVVIS